jgi:hypothetical protein
MGNLIGTKAALHDQGRCRFLFAMMCNSCGKRRRSLHADWENLPRVAGSLVAPPGTSIAGRDLTSGLLALDFGTSDHFISDV